MKPTAYLIQYAMAEPILSWHPASDCVSCEPLFTGRTVEAQAADRPSQFGSPELQAMIVNHAAQAADVGELPQLDDEWVVAVRKADAYCPSELSTPDRWKWKANYIRAALKGKKP